MKNKWLESGAMLGFLAITECAFAHPFSGFYGNIKGGLLITETKINAAAAGDNFSFLLFGPFPGFTTLSQEEKVWNNSVVGASALGYGQSINDWFHFAGEVFVNVSNSRATLENSATTDIPGFGLYSTNLNVSTSNEVNNWEFGFDLLPGVMIDPCNLFYTRIGIAFNKLSLESDINFNAVFDGIAENGTFNLSKDNNKPALRLGLGLEHSIGSKFSVTGDYIFTYYGTIEITGVRDLAILDSGTGEILVVNPEGLAGNASAKFYTHAVMMGLKYYFL